MYLKTHIVPCRKAIGLIFIAEMFNIPENRGHKTQVQTFRQEIQGHQASSQSMTLKNGEIAMRQPEPSAALH